MQNDDLSDIFNNAEREKCISYMKANSLKINIQGVSKYL